MAVDENLRFSDKDLFQCAARNLTRSRMHGGRIAMSSFALRRAGFTAADVCLDQCGKHCRMSNFELGGVLLSAFLIQVKLSNALG